MEPLKIGVGELKGFHIHVARRMSERMPRKRGGTWEDPKVVRVLQAVVLPMVKSYINVRRQTVANFTITRPIFDICREQRGGKEPCPTSFDGIRLLIWNWPYCPVMTTEICQSMRRMETDTAGQAEGTGMRCLTPPRANVNFEDSN